MGQKLKTLCLGTMLGMEEQAKAKKKMVSGVGCSRHTSASVPLV